MTVKEDFPLPALFNRLLERREHIVAVVDNFGGTTGIVTLEDVIETLLGAGDRRRVGLRRGYACPGQAQMGDPGATFGDPP